MRAFSWTFTPGVPFSIPVPRPVLSRSGDIRETSRRIISVGIPPSYRSSAGPSHQRGGNERIVWANARCCCADRTTMRQARRPYNLAGEEIRRISLFHEWRRRMTPSRVDESELLRSRHNCACIRETCSCRFSIACVPSNCIFFFFVFYRR